MDQRLQARIIIIAGVLFGGGFAYMGVRTVAHYFGWF